MKRLKIMEHIAKTKFYEILGEEYILLAFQYAHE